MVMFKILKIHVKALLVFFLLGASSLLFSQTKSPSIQELKPNPEKEAKFLPYLAVRHGGMQATEEWKKNNTVQYYRELWYYCESFYVKRGHFSEGVTLNEEIIDISRFESSRMENQEAIVELPGFKDVLVLLPANKLIYKP